MNKATERLANKYAGKSCTLGGKAAIVTGRLCNFAAICMLEEPLTSVEYAWPTVDRIMMNNGGNFKL